MITNHVHILATPQREDSISKTKLSLGRQYVRHFNATYRRICTLWEGRYKSCVVEPERYLLICHRYIELNPVRAGMVGDPSNYRWSSYRSNGLGERGFKLKPGDEYPSLGRWPAERQKAYRALFDVRVDAVMIKQIRESVDKGLVLGSERLKDDIKASLNRRVRPAEMGRQRLGVGQEPK